MPPRRAGDSDPSSSEHDGEDTTVTPNASEDEEEEEQNEAVGAQQQLTVPVPVQVPVPVSAPGPIGSPDALPIPVPAMPATSADAQEPQPVLMTNRPNDEVYGVEDDRNIQTPPTLQNQESPQGQRPGGAGHGGRLSDSSSAAAVAGGHLMTNQPMDERLEVTGAHNIPTPRASTKPTEYDDRNHPVGTVVNNAPHDEEVEVEGGASSTATPVKLNTTTSGRGGGGAGGATGSRAMVPDDDDDDDDEEEEADEEVTDEGDASVDEVPTTVFPTSRRTPVEAATAPITAETVAADRGSVPAAMTPGGMATVPGLEYNPADYAKVNAKASREMQELFRSIGDFQPFTAELPAMLRPFIPEYIPAVGDLDPFIKVPRPDGRPDGLGLYVIDEPTIPQSNPAVVLLELRATNVGAAGGVEVVDSFEDAANRPEVIDRWIADVKKVHYKKALPTVNYQKPMPEIESLLQVWPASFEEVLNSDIQFPPPHVDLDMEQYIRTMCAVLDIPTHTSLIDSLHVMFTLYEEFRANQHFQHE